jgi:alpha-amylase/alpha-mannosidase (GH57 family)
LRDQLIPVFEENGRKLFRDPWQARDEYIQVVRDRSPANVESFLHRHRSRKLTAAEQVDALRLLEMQRQALFMYTSCGWFFEEISRPEGVQILRYAARAMELAGDVAGVQLEKSFLKRLSQALSNVDLFKHGAEVYRQLVISAQITFKQVAAHYAISSLFTTYPPQQRLYCYNVHCLDYQMQRMGPLTLAIGQLQLTSEITWESEHLVFAVLHLGGWDFHCCIQPFAGRRPYTNVKEKVFAALQQASAAQTMITMTQLFGTQSFNLQNLFAEERHRIMQLLSQKTLTGLHQLYTQVYRDNYGVLKAFQRDELPVPQELQVAAEIALGHRFLISLRSLEGDNGEPQQGSRHLAELEAIATEANNLRCHLNIPEGKKTLEQLILRSLWHLLHDANPVTVQADIQKLERMIDVGKRLNLGLILDRCQELYFSCLHSQIIPQCKLAIPAADSSKPGSEPHRDVNHLRHLLKLGQKLAVDVSFWFNQLG